jgi:hypothetical protein
VKRLRNCEFRGCRTERFSFGGAVAVREEGQMEWFARPKRKPRSDKGSSKRKATDARFDGMPVLLPVCQVCEFDKFARLRICQVAWRNGLGGRAIELGRVSGSTAPIQAHKQYAHPWGAGQGERRRFKKSQALTSPTSRSRPELARTSHQRQIPGALRILCKASVGCA